MKKKKKDKVLEDLSFYLSCDSINKEGYKHKHVRNLLLLLMTPFPTLDNPPFEIYLLAETFISYQLAICV